MNRYVVVAALLAAFSLSACGAGQNPRVRVCAQSVVEDVAKDILERVIADGGSKDKLASRGLKTYVLNLAKKFIKEGSEGVVRCALSAVVDRLAFGNDPRGALMRMRFPTETTTSMEAALFRAQDLQHMLSEVK